MPGRLSQRKYCHQPQRNSHQIYGRKKAHVHIETWANPCLQVKQAGQMSPQHCSVAPARALRSLQLITGATRRRGAGISAVLTRCPR